MDLRGWRLRVDEQIFEFGFLRSCVKGKSFYVLCKELFGGL